MAHHKQKFRREYSDYLNRTILCKEPAFLLKVNFKEGGSSRSPKRSSRSPKHGASHTYTTANNITTVKQANEHPDAIFKLVASQFDPPGVVSLINRYIAMTPDISLQQLKKYISGFKNIKATYNSYLENHLRVLASDDYGSMVDIDGDKQSKDIISKVFPAAKIATVKMTNYIEKRVKADLTIFNNCLHHYPAETLNRIKVDGSIIVCDMDIAGDAKIQLANTIHNLYAYVLDGNLNPEPLNYLSKLDVITLFKKKVLGESRVVMFDNLLNEYAILL